MTATFAVYPATPDRWDDLRALLAEEGSCWCMYYRLRAREFTASRSADRRLALKALVDAGQAPGLLAYDGAVAVGWVSLAPREQYQRLANTRAMRAIDGQPVWSLVCYYVRRSYRGQGVSRALTHAALLWAADHGASIVEAYPTVAATGELVQRATWHYFAATLAEFGFVEVARPAPQRAVMRYYINRAGGAP